MDYKLRIRAGHKFYSQDLTNRLFNHSYTKIDFLQQDLQVSRLAGAKYLDTLAVSGFYRSKRSGEATLTLT